MTTSQIAENKALIAQIELDVVLSTFDAMDSYDIACAWRMTDGHTLFVKGIRTVMTWDEFNYVRRLAEGDLMVELDENVMTLSYDADDDTETDRADHGCA